MCVSEEVIAELSAPTFLEGPAALDMLNGLPILRLSPEVRGLATIFVKQKVMPGPAFSGDAIHVAVATTYSMDYMVSWNVKHLANVNKRNHLAHVCLRLGLTPPLIVTPDLLW